MSKGHATALTLLDLSAAFDTIDHSILLNCLRKCFGIKDVAFKWLKSYLSDRTQLIKLGNTRSDPQLLSFGVPQGSVLGPLLFSLYTTPLSQIIGKFRNFQHHLYADDTQIYITITPENASTSFTKLNDCLNSVQDWMFANKLKLNPDKTEFIIIGTDKT